MIENHLFNSPSETQQFAADLAKRISVGRVVALIGDLGTGKTTFAQGFARGLGVVEQVGSPTFKIVSEYVGDKQKLFHVDCYRLSGEVDFLNIGGEALLNPIGAVTLIEWADIIQEILPVNTIYIRFSRSREVVDQRQIQVEGLG